MSIPLLFHSGLLKHQGMWAVHAAAVVPIQVDALGSLGSTRIQIAVVQLLGCTCCWRILSSDLAREHVLVEAAAAVWAGHSQLQLAVGQLAPEADSAL